MSALAFRTRSWFRRRWRLVLVTGLLIGLTSGVAMGLVAGTRRTSSAPDRYTRWAGGDPDLEVVQLGGAPLIDAVSSVPGVARVAGVSFVAAFLRGPDGNLVFEPNPFAGDDRVGGARVVEGRFTDPEEPDEFTGNRAMAALLRRRFNSHVGDEFDVASFDATQLQSNRAFNSGQPPAVPVFRTRWVGVVETPADFEEGTPAFYYSKAFLHAHPTVGVVQTIMQIDVKTGTNPPAVLDTIHSFENGRGAFATSGRIVSAESRRAVRFQATALWIVTVIALLGTAIVAMQLAGRSVRQRDDETHTLLALGLCARELAIERAIRALACVTVAIPVAVLVMGAVSLPFPLGSLRAFEPHPGAQVDWSVVALGIVALTLCAVVGGVVAGRRDHDHIRRAHRSMPRRVTLTRGGMPLAVGAHYARVGPSGARRSAVALAVGVIAMTGLLGAGIVALSLDTIVNTPRRWGVNYDQLFGNPYVEADTDIVTPVVHDADVTQLSAVHIGSLTIDGHETPTLAVDAVKGRLYPTTLEGRPPTRTNEIGLGAEVARRLHVRVGDQVTVMGATGAKWSARVVGIVVTPDAGGGGASVTFDAYKALNPGATRNVLLAQLSPDSSRAAIDRIAAANFSPPDALPVPASMRALRRVLPAPVVLEIVLALLLLVGCAFLLTLSVRSERRDLAILRALGARRRQLRAIVYWQATLIALAILLIAVPAGIVLGRWTVSQLTSTLGVVPGVELPLLVLLAVVIATILLANLVALLPARRAARPAVALLNREQ
jgi:putative ABC transport system permease protein